MPTTARLPTSYEFPSFAIFEVACDDAEATGTWHATTSHHLLMRSGSKPDCAISAYG
jgi:hypothetical protein